MSALCIAFSAYLNIIIVIAILTRRIPSWLLDCETSHIRTAPTDCPFFYNVSYFCRSDDMLDKLCQMLSS